MWVCKICKWLFDKWLFHWDDEREPDTRSGPINQASKSDLTPQALDVHKRLYDQVTFLKQQQWTVTKYVGIIYGAIFALSAKELSRDQIYSLMAVIALAALYGICLLCRIQHDLGAARVRLDNANLDIFGSTDWKTLGMKIEKKPYIRGFEFTNVMMIVIALGALILGYYLYHENSSPHDVDCNRQGSISNHLASCTVECL